MQVSNTNQSVPQIELNLPRPDNVPSFAGLKQDNVNVAQFTIPSFANQSTSSPSLASNQLTSSTAMSSSTETTKSSKSSSKEDRSELKCRVCAHQDCDLNIFSCGCSFHARCLPTTTFIPSIPAGSANDSNSNNLHDNSHLQQRQNQRWWNQAQKCPSCMQPVEGIYIYPLERRILDEASECNQTSMSKSGKKTSNKSVTDSLTNNIPKKRSFDSASISFSNEASDSDDAATISAAAAPYLIYSKNLTNIECSDNDKLHFRTGRWTSSETDYVESLTGKFDAGMLNLPQGIKLNEFLRDMLLCKSSRLTKKFKNAKLSTKLFQTRTDGNRNKCGEDNPSSAEVAAEYAELSRLQENFLNNLSDVNRLIVKFNMGRMWRLHLFNSCLQSGYEKVQADDWLKSLEELEARVADAEASVKRVRRRRMEIAFRHDSMANKDSSNPGGIYVKSRSNSIGGVSKSGTAVASSKDTKTGQKQEHVNKSASVIPMTFLPAYIQQPKPSTAVTRLNNSCHPASGMTIMEPKKQAPKFSMPPKKVATISISSFEIPALPLNTLQQPPVCTPPTPTPAPTTEPTSLNVFREAKSRSSTEVMQGTDNTTGMSTGVEPVPLEIFSISENRDDDGFSVSFMDIDFDEIEDPYLNGGSSDSDSGYTSNQSPFVTCLLSFLQKENLPFHFVDVWIPSCPSNSKNSSINGITSESKHLKQNAVRLVHGGCAARSDLPPATKLQLNEFGLYSKKFVFDSGAGMPGRVYASSNYSWETKVQNAHPDHFERVGGAKMCNIQTAVGIPVECSYLGCVVVGLYSIYELNEDREIACRLIMKCQQIDPKPKWTLFMDSPTPIGSNANKNVSRTSLPECQESRAATCAASVSSHGSDLTSTMSLSKDGGELSESDANIFANLLAAYMPVAEKSSSTMTSTPLSDFIALRLLLLRYPSGCTEHQKNCLAILKRSYEGYVKVNMSNPDIANMLVKDWVHMNTDDSSTNSPWGLSISHVNYSAFTNSTPAMTPSDPNAQTSPPPPPSAYLLPPATAAASTGAFASDSKNRTVSISSRPSASSDIIEKEESKAVTSHSVQPNGGWFG